MLVSEVHRGKNLSQEYNPVCFFYVEDPRGSNLATNGTKVSRVDYKNEYMMKADLLRYKKAGKQTFEGFVRTTFKTLERYFSNQSKEKLNKSYFDIETDFHEERGYAPASDPFNRVTAISVFNSWENTLYSLSLKPDTLTKEEAELALEGIPNNVICDTEEEMFMLFFELTQDTNVYIGWNSMFYDIPYLVNRVRKIMGNDATKKFCLWNQVPVKREVEKYGKTEEVYDLIGKVHLDMLELYQKYTYSELASYRLDYVAEIEVKEHKVPYQGTLDSLYKNDYRKFIEYSRQDTGLLKKIDSIKNHVNLVFQIAHENLVDIRTVLGAVALSDNAIVLEAHRRNLVVPDRTKSADDNSKIAGGWALNPVRGLTEKVGSVDLTSLYPSVFRALNMSPETIVGQVRHTITGPHIQGLYDEGKDPAAAWSGFFNVEETEIVLQRRDDIVIFDTVDGDSIELTGAELHDFIFSSGFIISANGTIFRTDVQGVIPSLLERWFNERIQFQNRANVYSSLIDGIEIPTDLLNELNTL